MTLTYSGSFGSLLLRWRGSVWKSVSVELFMWLLMYYAINLPYRFAMTEPQRRRFEEIVVYVDKMTGYIPLTFLLGFYVSQVMSRWYTSFNSIPWTDALMIRVLTYMPQRTEEATIYRRTIARWAVASMVLCWRLITIRIRKRFPTMKHMVRAGLLTDDEVKIIELIPAKHGNWFVPLTWICNLTDPLVKKELTNATGQREIMAQVDSIRDNLQQMLIQDWIVIPLVYTQVVAVATYGYFTITLLSRQMLDESQKLPGCEIDHFVPVFTILQFVFYMGWMKVGEDLMRPFGEDDDDFEFNYLLERHMHVALLYADQLPGIAPEAIKDRYWGIGQPEIPYTVKSLLRPDIMPTLNIPRNQLNRVNENDEVLDENEEIQRFLNETNNWQKHPLSFFTRDPKGKFKVDKLKSEGKLKPIEPAEEPNSTMAADVVDGKVTHELESSPKPDLTDPTTVMVQTDRSTASAKRRSGKVAPMDPALQTADVADDADD